MSKDELEDYRHRLLELRGRFQGDISQLSDEALKSGAEHNSNLSKVPLHPADLGTDSFEQELTLGFLEKEERILEEILAALARIQAGTFGNCEECHKKIPQQRLEVLPYARHCVDCASKSIG
jgi:RNA polymerase-binding protein DksA